MIFSKILLNKLVDVLKDKFKIDKMFDYVFDDNELDDKVKNLESRIIFLENNRLTCKCKKRRK
tara:strand:- start:60 stop:248 length:189 start_codon:yes stop_codon:yes gene_type:complete